MRTIRTRLRFRLSALLIAMTAICIVLGWQVSRAHRQARAVKELQQLQATIIYDYDKEDRELSGPKWLRRLLGPHYFDHVVAVEFVKPHLIGDDEARWLADLPDIKRLGLQETRVTNAGMVHLRKMADLEWLVLYHTAVTDDGFRHLEGLRNLEYLNIHGMAIGDDAFSHLAKLVNLKTLYAARTRVADDGARSLANLTRLEILDLGRTRVTDSGLAHISRLTELRELMLSRNEVTSEGMRHLANLQKLKRLDLGGCPIDDGAVEHLIGLKKLRSMHLGYVNMTYGGLKRWLDTRYMPSVYIDGESFADLREHSDYKNIQRRQGLLGMGSGLTIGPALERELDLNGLRERTHGSVP